MTDRIRVYMGVGGVWRKEPTGTSEAGSDSESCPKADLGACGES